MSLEDLMLPEGIGPWADAEAIARELTYWGERLNEAARHMAERGEYDHDITRRTLAALGELKNKIESFATKISEFDANKES